MARGASRSLSEQFVTVEKSLEKLVGDDIAEAILYDPVLSLGDFKSSDGGRSARNLITVKDKGTIGHFAIQVYSIAGEGVAKEQDEMEMSGIKGRVRGIYLHMIESNRPGGGNLALKKVIELSEKFNLPIFLGATAYSAQKVVVTNRLDSKDLVSWYGRNGFKKIPSTKSFPDPTKYTRMVRIPTNYKDRLEDVLVNPPAA